MNTDITFVKDWLTPLIIFTSIILAGIIIQRFIIVYVHKLSAKNKWKAGVAIIRSLRGMIVLISILVGINLGLSNSPLPANVLHVIQKLHNVFVPFIITFIAARLLTGMLRAYMHRGEDTHSSLSLVNTIINIIVYSLGGLIILQAIGISITPIITALGIGGLAVALALQDTLSNLFAGIQITLTRNTKPGDYIILSSGEEGTVRDITWRNTMLLTQSNNVVVIPNSKLASTVLTNYSLPEESLSVSLNIGVSYDSDLEKVERVTLEVTKAVLLEFDIPDGEPTFRYKEFGNAAINCTISFTVLHITRQYIIRHTLIKRLYKRYKEEGIVIPFPPVNTVYLKKEN
ncbi:MAG TPA: mechanosensitive ion channel family protein [Bacteroidia bacterium]|jgi:small-conductance mechanosensitive channel|nr:mechanosensitive ion channel family protein [Bacteroidia bacterium]